VKGKGATNTSFDMSISSYI